MTTKTHIGSNFDGFLREEGIYDQTQAVAFERMLAYERERHRDRQERQFMLITPPTRSRDGSHRWPVSAPANLGEPLTFLVHRQSPYDILPGGSLGRILGRQVDQVACD
jgi:hypothetical protein